MLTIVGVNLNWVHFIMSGLTKALTEFKTKFIDFKILIILN